MKKYFEYIVVGLLIVLLLQGLFSVPEGVSDAEVEYRIEIDRLKNKNIELLNKNNELENNIKRFQNEVIKNDSIIDNADNKQLDSLLTEFFSKRR